MGIGQEAAAAARLQLKLTVMRDRRLAAVDQDRMDVLDAAAATGRVAPMGDECQVPGGQVTGETEFAPAGLPEMGRGGTGTAKPGSEAVLASVLDKPQRFGKGCRIRPFTGECQDTTHALNSTAPSANRRSGAIRELSAARMPAFPVDD